MIKWYAVPALMLLSAPLAAGAQVVSNASFEEPRLTLGYYAYDPAVDGMTFYGAGVQANSYPWGFGAAPDGVQTAFLQGDNWFSQSVTGLTNGEFYTISFFDAFRANTELYASAPYSVSFNGQVIGRFEPSQNEFRLVTTDSFLATSENGILVFRGLVLDNLDRAVGIDNVTISRAFVAAATPAVPEPATWMTMLLGFGVLGHIIRRWPAKNLPRLA
jgi:hypothetical protein